MVRSGPRWIVAGEDRFLWSAGHLCRPCRSVARFRREGSPGQLMVEFISADGHWVPHIGGLLHADGRYLNLNEPGVIRAVLDEALVRGWQTGTSTRAEMDGWDLFDAVFARHSARKQDEGRLIVDQTAVRGSAPRVDQSP